jgi:hypothetical protein
MFAVLVAIRDFLVALALAWVGISMEPRSPDSGCAGDRCQAEQTR